WHDRRDELDKFADQLVTVVRRSLAGSSLQGRVALTRALAEKGRVQLADQFDSPSGGFGFSPENPRRPKFPEPVNLVFLLDKYRRGAKGPPGSGLDPLDMVVSTLDHMARGGIRDQLAGGYHRYSTNRTWSVPHFEKMLYD